MFYICNHWEEMDTIITKIICTILTSIIEPSFGFFLAIGLFFATLINFLLRRYMVYGRK